MNFEGGKEMLEKKHTKMNDEEKNDWEKLTIGLKMTMMTNPKKNDLFGRPIEFCRHFFFLTIDIQHTGTEMIS